MSVEVQALVGVALLLLLVTLIQGAAVPLIHGFGWGLGSRDEPRDATAFQGRLGRIRDNMVEGLLIFAALVLAIEVAGVSSGLTQSGALVYLAARAAFVALYLFGVPVLRSVAYGAGLVGLLMMVYGLSSVLMA